MGAYLLLRGEAVRALERGLPEASPWCLRRWRLGAASPLFLPPPLLQDPISLVHLPLEHHFAALRGQIWYVDLLLGCEWRIHGYAQGVPALFRWLSKKYPKISAFVTFSVGALCVDPLSKFFLS